MKNLWGITSLVMVLALAALVGCAGTAPSQASTASGLAVNLNSQQTGIWVSGQGEVLVIPDIATASLGISAQMKSVAEAQSAAAGAMDKVMTALTQNGVAKKDIQTQNFSIQQVTQYDKDKQQEIVIGYRVTNMVVAKIRDINKTGTIIDAVAVAGGDLTRVSGINFSVDNPAQFYDEARQKAMADANARAKQLADLGKVTLGKPTYISETSTFPVPRSVFQSAAGVAVPAPMPVTAISAGELKITLNVQVAYAILN